MRRSAPHREILLELRNIGTQAESALIQSSGNRRVDLLAERPHLRGQVEVWNGFVHLKRNILRGFRCQAKAKPPIAVEA